TRPVDDPSSPNGSGNLSDIGAFESQGTPTPSPTATPTPGGSCSFNNGGTGSLGLNPSATTESGVAAPAGFFWSELQHPAGNTTESNAAGGFSVTSGSLRLADNFTLTQ